MSQDAQSRPFRDPKMAKIRESMVSEQIVARGVRDSRVLNAMRRVPREMFVLPEDREMACGDGPLPIGYDQTISQPYIVAYMTERLVIGADDRVLEIGTGSGYQTAILATLAAEVYTIELVEPLSLQARVRLTGLGYKNIRFKIGNGWEGWTEEAPFDRIIVTAAADEIPATLIEQLNEDGRMIVPVGIGTQELIEGEKHHGILKTHRDIAVRFVPLIKNKN